MSTVQYTMYIEIMDLSLSLSRVRLTETIDMSLTTKFVYITWFGKDVSFVKRGKYGVVSGSVEKFFNVSPYTLYYIYF